MSTALVVGNMIGSGVYLLPATLAPYGWNALFGWIVTIAGGLCLAFVFARLARALPREGGPYAYTRAAFGPAVAFLVAWSYWVCIWVGNAAVATGSVSYLSVFFPEIANVPGLHAVVTLAAIWLFTAVNCLGVQAAGRVQLFTAIIKLLPLLGVIALAAAALLGRAGGDSSVYVAPFHAADLGLPGVTASATLALWALLGLESATIPADSVADPERTIPRATMFGVIVTGGVYLLACTATTLLMPAEQMAKSTAPFTDFVSHYLDPRAGAALAAFAAFSGFGALNGWILLQGELPYAMAKDGVFPRWLAKTSSRGAPVRAHLVTSGLLSIVVLMNYSKSMTEAFKLVILLSTTASLFMYLGVALAALVLERRGGVPRSPVLFVIAAIAAAYSLWAIAGAGGEAVFWGVVLLAAGGPVYWLMRRGRRKVAAPSPP
jgi:APA family basic amino acid/polyamine antiporter